MTVILAAVDDTRPEISPVQLFPSLLHPLWNINIRWCLYSQHTGLWATGKKQVQIRQP